MYKKFDRLQTELAKKQGITLNTEANGEHHLTEVECYICTIKECAQRICNILPFQIIAFSFKFLGRCPVWCFVVGIVLGRSDPFTLGLHYCCCTTTLLMIFL